MYNLIYIECLAAGPSVSSTPTHFACMNPSMLASLVVSNLSDSNFIAGEED